MPLVLATSTIVAQAFRFMEKGPISSFADTSTEASDAAEQYPIALGMCLEEEDWSFARKFDQLARVATLPVGTIADPDLPYAYKLPSDLVQFREVLSTPIKWRIDSDFFWCDTETPPIVRHTWMIDQESKLPSWFQTTVAYQLADKLAPVHVGARTKRQEIKDGLAAAMRKAKKSDAHTASQARWDGQAEEGDWATEVTR